MSAYGLARIWWLILLRGLLAVLFGLAAVVQPNLTLAALVLIFGAYALADGILAVTAGLTLHNASRPWRLLLIEGLVGIGAGITTVLSPGLTAIALLYLVAAWALVTGSVAIVAALQLRREIAQERLLIWTGILSVALGMVFVLWPAASAPVVGRLVAGYALGFGLLLVMLGFRMWNWQQSGRQMTLRFA